MLKIIINIIFLLATMNLKTVLSIENICNGIDNVVVTQESAKRYDVTKRLTGKDSYEPTSSDECIRYCKNAWKKGITGCSHVQTVTIHGRSSAFGVVIPTSNYICKFFNGNVGIQVVPDDQKKFFEKDKKIITRVTRAVDCYTAIEKENIQKKATAKWKNLYTCYGGSKFAVTCTYEKTYGYSRTKTDGTTTTNTDGSSYSFTSSLSATLESEGSAGFATARASMTASMSQTLGFNWSRSTAVNTAITTEETEQTTTSAEFTVSKGEVATICQPWGTIGDFVIKPTVYRRFDTRCCSNNPRDC